MWISMDINHSNNRISAWINEIQQNILEKDIDSIIEQFKENYIGILDDSQLLQNILRARRFFSSSAYFGYRLGKNMLTLCPTNLTKNYDLYFTDCNGVVKTDVHENL